MPRLIWLDVTFRTSHILCSGCHQIYELDDIRLARKYHVAGKPLFSSSSSSTPSSANIPHSGDVISILLRALKLKAERESFGTSELFLHTLTIINTFHRPSQFALPIYLPVGSEHPIFHSIKPPSVAPLLHPAPITLLSLQTLR